MPNVVDVRDHWIELYSADPEVTAPGGSPSPARVQRSRG
jgi:hypothetical protein